MREGELAGVVLDGKYKLEKLLGEGGMGVVYQGTHLLIGRKIAVKFLHQALSVNEEAVKRFYREARAAAAIGHKSIIDVLDVGIHEDTAPYLVMEFLEGEGLAEIMDREVFFSLPQTVAVLEPVLLALYAAHERSVVHRDLKPDNIFIVHHGEEPPTVKLIDFGISKVSPVDGSTKLTQDGSMLGTPAYMSPEQARGSGDLDHRTDLYSMGVILFEMLTGGMPFEGEQYNELIFNVITAQPKDPVDIQPDFPPRAWPVIKKALSKNPDDRYQSAKEMLEDLRALAGVEERAAGMEFLRQAMKTDGFVSGDLGPLMDPPRDGSVASVVFSETVAVDRGPSLVDDDLEKEKERRKAPVWLFVGAGLILLLFVSLTAVVLLSGEEEKVESPFIESTLAGETPADGEVEKEAEPKEEGVSIEVVAVPKGAKIYYEDSLVPMNPFKVKKADTLARLRVEKKGYEPFKVSIVPSRDRRVKVKLQKEKMEPEPEEKSDVKQEVAPAPAPKKKAKQPAKKGKKKTKIRKFFERLTQD